jgi:trimethylamine--corrinoid protein Co-methyltransferase
MSVVRPRITLLNEDQIARVHRYSLEILSSVGVRVDSAAAREVLARAIGRPTADDRVCLPPNLVEWALQTAPSTIDIYDRHGTPVFRLGEADTRFGIGVTALYYQEPLTDCVTPFTRRHMEATTRLGHGLSSYDVVSTVGIVQDVPPELSDLYATLEMTANTTKPLVILISDEDCFPAVLNLLEHLHGDLASRPFIIPYFNPISPLVLNRGTTDKMLHTIERGLPFIFSNYGMAGATTPITPAGTLALLNAELLAGLTLSQLVRAGTPIVVGSLPASFDMRGTGSFYDTSGYLLNLACAEMMAAYQLPHAGTSGSGMGWGPDILAGANQWINHLTSCVGRVGLAPFVGDNLGSKAFSPALVVYANEVIAQARRFAQGFELDDESAGLSEINDIGPGGDFLISETTLKRFRQATYRSEIFANLSLEEWQAQGCPRAAEKLRRHTAQLLNRLQPPDDHGRLIEQGEAFIRASQT